MARPRSDIRAHVVRAARRRFLRAGVDGSSLRRIAREAHTSIGMIQYYFPKKDDLFLAVVEETYAELMDKLSVALDPSLPVRERVQRLYAAIANVKPREIDTIRLVVREALNSSTRFEKLFTRFQRGHIALVLATALDGQSDGTFDPELPPALVVMSLFALGAPPQLLRRAVGNRAPFAAVPEGEELAERLVKVLFNGVAGVQRG